MVGRGRQHGGLAAYGPEEALPPSTAEDGDRAQTSHHLGLIRYDTRREIAMAAGHQKG